jgi:osmoprotectant transport system ATP-binding protein
MPSAVAFRKASVRSSAGLAILRDIDLEVAPGEAVAFIGRSGAGKTTALRLINGLVAPSSGDVLFDGQPLAKHDVIAIRRRIGYVIQGSGLLPHRNVYDNIAIVPRLVGWPEERTMSRARELLELLQLDFDACRLRFPRTLSGGEQQRVALARALAANPDVLLCDEPFGALDPIVRRELQEAFRRLRDSGTTTIAFVTHDLHEALRVARRLVMFEHGQIIADAHADRFAQLPDPRVRQFVAAATDEPLTR